jgi:hypothetical protein
MREEYGGIEYGGLPIPNIVILLHRNTIRDFQRSQCLTTFRSSQSCSLSD